MLSCYLKGRKNTKSKTTKVVRIENGRKYFYQNTKCVIVKHRNLADY